MPKYFVDKSDISADTIIIRDDNYNHIKNVFRLTVGEQITVNDKLGNDYQCVISSVEQNIITATIFKTYVATTEPVTNVVLFQSLIKGDKMEYVIQKAVELGAAKVVPIVTTRCVVKLEDDKKTRAKVDRWNKISEAASKQSGRGTVIEVLAPMKYTQALELAKNELEVNLIPYEKQVGSGIKSVLQSISARNIGIFIGPEGGFEDKEVELAHSYGLTSVTLGKRILKSETASIAVLASLMYQMDEMQ
ncbi:MAG: hypothetical protein ATN33_08000 [Epulopiscium sp. Nele67-Bin001]|nr:MAG: hypothetical protein ATN33_08000 [Epulopiscium sp. Nele67-Bin001]